MAYFSFRSRTFCVLITSVFWCISIQFAGAFEGAAVVSQGGYDDCIRLHNDQTTVVLCPAAGGRVLEYASDGANVLHLSSDDEAGQFDIGPENIVKRGDVLWSGVWKGEVIGNRKARMTSQFDPESGVRLIREFHLHESDSQLRCTQTIINESKRSVSLCHWGRTLAVTGGIAIVPRTPRGRFVEGYVMYEGQESIQLQPSDENIRVDKDTVVVSGPPKHPKLGFESQAGWLAYLTPANQLFVKRFKTYPDRAYNEAAGCTAFVRYPESGGVGLEPIGPAENLMPWKSASFTEQWWILPHEFPANPNDIQLDQIRKKIKRRTTPAGALPGTIISPEVHADRSVTFRFVGSDSKSVSVILKHKPRTMNRDADGLWKTTIPPLEPGIYDYTFNVDGVRVTDPRNRWTKKWFVCASMFEIPGENPQLTQQADVPHGTVHRHLYESETTGGQRAAVVYTPPGYDIDDAQPYPVMVLCHGFGDDETAWTEVGRAHHIMDNLLSQELIPPMVVVMPNGHPLSPEKRTWSEDYNARNSELLVRDILNDLLPLVEKNYHVTRDPQRRAVTGLSMGGGHSIMMAMTHPESFAWVGAFSASAPDGEFDKHHPEWIQDATNSNEQRRLFWIACGNKDFLLDRNHKFVNELERHGIQHTYVETVGAHSWEVWRKYLPAFTQQLFR